MYYEHFAFDHMKIHHVVSEKSNDKVEIFMFSEIRL